MQGCHVALFIREQPKPDQRRGGVYQSHYLSSREPSVPRPHTDEAEHVGSNRDVHIFGLVFFSFPSVYPRVQLCRRMKHIQYTVCLTVHDYEDVFVQRKRKLKIKVLGRKRSS